MLLGVNPNRRSTAPDHGLLTSSQGLEGREWLYVKASAAIAQFDAVGIDEAGAAAPLTKAMADDGWRIGVAAAGFLAGEYGFVQARGATTVAALANCAADVALYTTATAGSLDDDATSQTKIVGVHLTAAVGGSPAAAAADMPVRPFVTL